MCPPFSWVDKISGEGQGRERREGCLDRMSSGLLSYAFYKAWDSFKVRGSTVLTGSTGWKILAPMPAVLRAGGHSFAGDVLLFE